MSVMPGLKAMIQSIDRKVFRDFLRKEAPSMIDKIDWTTNPEHYPEHAFSILADTTKTPHDVREKIFPHLYEIHLLSENAKEGMNYRKRILEDKDAKKLWLDEFGLNVPVIQTIAAWMQVNANGLFQNILSNTLMKTKESNGGIKCYLKDAYEGHVEPKPFDKFRSELKNYLLQETGVKMHVSVERLDLAKNIRFTVYTDPFPKNEQHFKDASTEDTLDVRLSKKVDCFYFTLPSVRPGRQAYFQLKCDFQRTQREYIAKLFAECILKTETKGKCEQKRNLKPFRVRPPKFDFTHIDGYEDLRYEGMSVKVQSGGRRPDEHSWRYAEEDFFDHGGDVATRLPNTLEEAIDPQELYLSITLRVGEKNASIIPLDGMSYDDREIKDYSVTVRKSGDWISKPTALPSEVKKIDAVLEVMGLDDISGDKILKKTIRK